jgi:hypothetical protein
MIDKHFDNFPIAGFTYYDGVDVFKELEIGTELYFVAEPENKHDENAVALYFKDSKLGYVPRSRNKFISKFLFYGHTDLFEIKINRVSEDSNPEGQIGVVVKIKPKKIEEVKQ